MSDWKHCPDCDFSYPLDDFGIDRIKLDGRRPYCRGCDQERGTRWVTKMRKEQPERARRDQRRDEAARRTRGRT